MDSEVWKERMTMAMTKEQTNLQDQIRRDIAEGKLPPELVDQLMENGFIYNPPGKKKGSLAEAAPEIAAEWHPRLNGDLTPSDVSWAAKKNVWWLCPDCGHVYEMTIHRRTALHTNCQRCRRLKIAKDKSLAVKKPWLASYWDFVKNGELRMDDVPLDSERELFWHCPECGWEWKARPGKLVDAAHSCPACCNSEGFISSKDDPEAFYSYENVRRAPVVIYPLMYDFDHFVWFDQGEVCAFDMVDIIGTGAFGYCGSYSFRDFVEAWCAVEGRAWLSLEELDALEREWVAEGGVVPDKRNDKEAKDLADVYIRWGYFGGALDVVEEQERLKRCEEECKKIRYSYPGDLERGLQLLKDADTINAKAELWWELDSEHPWANGRWEAIRRGEIEFSVEDYNHLSDNVFKPRESEIDLSNAEGDLWRFIDWFNNREHYEKAMRKCKRQRLKSGIGKRCKEVICLETGKVYESTAEAAAAVGLKAVNISTAINNQYRAGGLHWARPDEFNLAGKALRICNERKRVKR